MKLEMQNHAIDRFSAGVVLFDSLIKTPFLLTIFQLVSGGRIFFLTNLTLKALNEAGVIGAKEVTIFFLKEGLKIKSAVLIWAAGVHAWMTASRIIKGKS